MLDIALQHFHSFNYSRNNISSARCLLNRTDFSSSTRGYHVLYGKTRTAVMGEQLLHKRKMPGLNVVARSICHGGNEGFLCHC